MWFVEDEKLLDNIAKRFCSMVADLKALVPVPTQKKARRGSKKGSRELLVSTSNKPGGTP